MLYGHTSAALPSRFLKEIPEDLIERKGGYHRVSEPAFFRSTPATNYRPTVVTPPKSKPMLELHKGDMVQHTAFGRGMVLSVLQMGGDALLEIAFDDIGTKKLMAKTASAHMKRL
jgi:DNA helicase-2/ATP-dependent DNA helicase PcrA